MKRSLVAVVLCSALAACEGLGDPADLEVGFVLDVEPAVVLESGSVRAQILEERLWLETDGTARREIKEHIDFPSPGPRDTTVTYEEEYAYEVDGTTIELMARCGPLALCAPGPHLWGQMTSEGLELRWLRDPEVVLSYQRLDP